MPITPLAKLSYSPSMRLMDCRRTSPAPRACINRKMDCLDDETPEHDAAELAAAQLVEKVKQADKSDCELPVVDESAVWIVSVKKAGIEGVK